MVEAAGVARRRSRLVDGAFEEGAWEGMVVRWLLMATASTMGMEVGEGWCGKLKLEVNAR